MPAEHRLIAPLWHTAMITLLIVGLSAMGIKRVHHFADHPLHLTLNYLLTIVYEWVLAGLTIWGIHMRGTSLRQLLGERRPGWRQWFIDLGAALAYWIVAVLVLSLLAQLLLRMPGSHLDPRKIGEITQKLAPNTGVEMVLFLLLSISAGICEEIVFRGYLQQQFTRAARSVWVGVLLAAIVFGCAHGYEGISGMVLITAYGAMFGVLALLRRSLRAGMIAHAWHDSVSGIALMLVRHYGLHLGPK